MNNEDVIEYIIRSLNVITLGIDEGTSYYHAVLKGLKNDMIDNLELDDYDAE
jgi:hypothetical protein